MEFSSNGSEKERGTVMGKNTIKIKLKIKMGEDLQPQGSLAYWSHLTSSLPSLPALTLASKARTSGIRNLRHSSIIQLNSLQPSSKSHFP